MHTAMSIPDPMGHFSLHFTHEENEAWKDVSVCPHLPTDKRLGKEVTTRCSCPWLHSLAQSQEGAPFGEDANVDNHTPQAPSRLCSVLPAAGRIQAVRLSQHREAHCTLQ